MGLLSVALRVLGWAIALSLIAAALHRAYSIRLYAINEFGTVIHEFDPWFNYRATEYLAKHGWRAFFQWFDHSSWYPVGRPVGTTIYPAMQIIAVSLWRLLEAAGATLKHVERVHMRAHRMSNACPAHVWRMCDVTHAACMSNACLAHP